MNKQTIDRLEAQAARIRADLSRLHHAVIDAQAAPVKQTGMQDSIVSRLLDNAAESYGALVRFDNNCQRLRGA